VDPFREYPDPQVKEVMILLDCSGSKERIRNEYELEKVAAALLRMQKLDSQHCPPQRTNMKQVILTGLAAALTVTVAGEMNSSDASPENHKISSQPNSSGQVAKTKAAQQVQTASATKVGERQSTTESTDSTVAKVVVHQKSGRQATTVYVRNIPIVTFLGAEQSAANPKGVKVATTELDPSKLAAIANTASRTVADPIWRATTIASKLNQLALSDAGAEAIKVVWNGKRESYLIEANNQHLIEVTAKNTLLPNSTKDAAKDALQIANRLRFQMGNAAPLKTVEGMPKPKDAQIVAMGPIRFQIQGMASWYGPGFDGQYTANGEVFNQYALTAAHRYLPFGTRVRVTNLDNGRSVVVRINDRGPFVGDRVLDLSRGAAQILGTVGSGVSSVRLDVLQ
jgi:rare lipoprotein A